MKSYKFIAHTADVRLHVNGSTLQELFLAALEGMNHIIAPHQCNKKGISTHVLSLSAQDTTVLLIDFLSTVLTQTQVTKNIFCHVQFNTLRPTQIEATIHGHPIEAFAEDIKAVTYHEANVKKNSRGDYETTIIFDI